MMVDKKTAIFFDYNESQVTGVLVFRVINEDAHEYDKVMFDRSFFKAGDDPIERIMWELGMSATMIESYADKRKNHGKTNS